jgi:hypothetical protein
MAGEPCVLNFRPETKSAPMSYPHAQQQTDHRPNEKSAQQACLDSADPSAASQTNAGNEGIPTKAKTNQDGSRARSAGDNDEACFPAKAAGSSEG